MLATVMTKARSSAAIETMLGVDFEASHAQLAPGAIPRTVRGGLSLAAQVEQLWSVSSDSQGCFGGGTTRGRQGLPAASTPGVPDGMKRGGGTAVGRVAHCRAIFTTCRD